MCRLDLPPAGPLASPPASNHNSTTGTPPEHCLPPPDSSWCRPSLSPSPAADSAADTTADSAADGRRRSRTIVPAAPAPRLRRLSPVGLLRPPTATASSQPTHAAGPASAKYEIPALPKPGRKPAQDEPSTKRKSQNRVAQRQFRARKEERSKQLASDVEKLTAEVKNLQVELQNAQSQFNAQIESERRNFEAQFVRKERECDYWKAVAENGRYQGQAHGQKLPPLTIPYYRHDSHSQSSQDDKIHIFPTMNHSISRGPGFSCSDCKAIGGCVCADTFPRSSSSSMTDVQPMTANTGEDQEHDFTTQHFSATRPRGSCGFCTDPLNCVCAEPPLPSPHQDGDTAPTGPGSCTDCQNNPAQKAWCQGVASLSRPSTNASPLRPPNTLEPPVSDASQPVQSSIGCSDAYKLLDGRVANDTRTMSNLNVLGWNQRDTFSMDPRKYSALELETAGVIASLQDTVQPLETRPSDGQHAELVKIAAQRQEMDQHHQWYT